MARKKPGKRWLPAGPARSPRPKIPAAFKERVQAEVDRLVAGVLRPRLVRPPRPESELNYVIDVGTRWFGGSLYLFDVYTCPGPGAGSPCFEWRFARMEYAGGDRFHLSFMRHTGRWIELYHDVPLNQALVSLRDDEMLQG